MAPGNFYSAAARPVDAQGGDTGYRITMT